MKNFKELSHKLLTSSWLYGQYFEVGSLFLRNVSSSSEPYIHQVYEVYKRDEETCTYFMFEVLTITHFHEKELEAWFVKHDDICVSLMTLPATSIPLRLHNKGHLYKSFSFKKIKAYKEIFNQYQATV